MCGTEVGLEKEMQPERKLEGEEFVIIHSIINQSK